MVGTDSSVVSDSVIDAATDAALTDDELLDLVADESLYCDIVLLWNEDSDAARSVGTVGGFTKIKVPNRER